MLITGPGTESIKCKKCHSNQLEIERRVRFEVYKTRAANQQKTIVKKARRNSPARRVVSCMYDFASLFGEIASDYSDSQGSDMVNLIHFQMIGAYRQSFWWHKDDGGRSAPFRHSWDSPIRFIGMEVLVMRAASTEKRRTPQGHPYEGKILPNMGRPLTDSFCVASSWSTSQCSARRPFSNRTMSAAIQDAGLPIPVNRPCAMT